MDLRAWPRRFAARPRRRAPWWGAVVALAFLAPCRSTGLARWRDRAELVLERAAQARARAQVRASPGPDPTFHGAAELR